MDTEQRWQRYQEFYSDNVAEILSQEFPQGIVSFITYIQEHFDLIRQRQDEEHCGGGSLFEYEVLLIMAIVEIGEDFGYVFLRELLESLFDDIFNPERIIDIGPGEFVITDEQDAQIKEVIEEIKTL
jgi:hypothetical protein